MLNSNKTKLVIFDNFTIDESLPKYSTGNLADVGGIQTNSRVGWSDRATFGTLGTDGDMAMRIKKPNIWQRLKYLWFGEETHMKQLEAYKKEPEPVKVTIEEFFKSIKNNSTELKKIEKRAESYEAAIKQAKDFGQDALVEKLNNQLDIVRAETQLYASGFKTVITH